MEKDYYLSVSKASDLKNPREHFVYRLFEIMPVFLSFTVLAAAISCSYYYPILMSLFIICFVVFWLFRTVYFAYYLFTGYRKMEQHKNMNWVEKLNGLPVFDYKIPVKSWHEVYHLIILPMYKEPTEIVREAIKSIKFCDYPKDKLIVVLACEERAKNEIAETAKEMEHEFGNSFYKFMVTWHPKDIVGELAGKGSNETWAAKKAKEGIIDKLNAPVENIVFSSFDIDTCIYPGYFSCLTYKYLTVDKPTRTSFQPIPLYINNVWQAPAVSRIFSFSCTFWHTMNQERPEKLVTFSSHSMSFKALVDVGFKKTNIVPDDSHIFWQCFFQYDGDYKVEPLYYPLSMDANVAETFPKTMLNIYKQQRRWAYGVADIPYFLFGAMKNKKIQFSKKFFMGFELIEGHLSWGTASILLFAMGWLPLLLGGDSFSHTLVSYNLPKIIGRIMTISMIGLLTSVYLSFLLLPPKPLQYTKSKYVFFFLGWLLFPLCAMFFTSIPALDAQIRLMLGKYMGFWVTEKVRK